MTARGWTVHEACGEFARAGMPVDQAGFRAVVRAARRTGRLTPIGEKRAPAGSKGGRGPAIYAIGDMQRLHAALAPWLTTGKP